MKHKKRIKTTLLLLWGILIALNAQQTIPASGGDAKGTGGKVSYTIGQIAYTISNEQIVSITQGVQQPYEISEITGIEIDETINIQCSAYPNPVSDYLIISIEGVTDFDCIASLYNLNGKVLKIKKLKTQETTINVGNLKPGTYFIKIVQIDNPALNQSENVESQQIIRTFKIIKK